MFSSEITADQSKQNPSAAETSDGIAGRSKHGPGAAMTFKLG